MLGSLLRYLEGMRIIMFHFFLASAVNPEAPNLGPNQGNPLNPKLIRLRRKPVRSWRKAMKAACVAFRTLAEWHPFWGVGFRV